MTLASRIDLALDLRRDRLADPDACVRVFAGAGDGVPGLVIDRFGRFVAATAYDPAMAPGADGLADLLAEAFPDALVLVRVRDADGFRLTWRPTDVGRRPSDVVLVATESGLRFEIRIDPRHDFGLFLDAAAARALVRSLSRGARVLNLFAYTCAFAVAACAGGAREVTNVDPERDYLTWGRRNAALNGFDFRVLPDTAQAYLARLRRRIERGAAARDLDLVVLDPPAFGVGRGDARILRKLWPDLLASIADLAPRDVVVCCNDRWLRERRDFAGMVRESLGGAWEVREVPQDGAVTGRDAAARDPWYLPPVALHLSRRVPS